MKFKKTLCVILSIVTVFGSMFSIAFSASAKAKSPWDYSSTPTRAIYYTSPVMKGNDVKWVQQSLNIVMNSKLELDGSFGPASKSATKKFQAKYGLSQDGSFGPATRAKMISVLKSKGYSEPQFSSSKYSRLATYYIGNTRYYKAKLLKAANGVAKNTEVFLTSSYKAVTDQATLKKLIFTDLTNQNRSNWTKLADNYKAVKSLNTACQKILTAEFQQKILGTTGGTLTGVFLTSNPLTLISAGKNLTTETYVVILTGIVLNTITEKALSNADTIKKYCSDGVSSYEEACNIKTALINAKAAFDLAGTDCMLGLASKYTSLAKATARSIYNISNSMFGTIAGAYGYCIDDVIEIYSTGKQAMDGLMFMYGRDNCENNAKKTFSNLLDANVNKMISAVVSTQKKIK